MAYVAAGLGLVCFAMRPQGLAAALAALGFLGLHAAFHLVEFAQGHGGGAAAVLGVIAPALIAVLAIPWPERKSPAAGEA